MGPKVATAAVDRHLERLETVRPAMVKADLKNLEIPWREMVGRALQRAFSLAGLTQKEGSNLLNRDQAQVARWIAGTERVQLDAVFAVESLRQPLVVALAELAGEGVEIETTVRIVRRRSA